jgi:LmbE family N-acetylglucosaminyl deacetylase
MDWIYLSPHLDDAALSCGGLIWEQTQHGNQVSIWTICAGDPPSGELSEFAFHLHERWGVDLNAVSVRRTEDVISCQLLGAESWHIPTPDCIYRTSIEGTTYLYNNNTEIFGEIHSGDQSLIENLRSLLHHKIPKAVNLVCPLTIGDHVDHKLTRKIAEQLDVKLWYYPDFPYVIDTRDSFGRHRMVYRSHQISQNAIIAWFAAIEAHESQLSTFWNSKQAMRHTVQRYLKKMGGIWLGSNSGM